jgi:hypothetical protein
MTSGWESFFAAEVTASAALLGLVFVAISINLTKIMLLPNLVHRALQTVVSFLVVLVLCSLLLVPAESVIAVGVQVLVIGLIGWGSVVALQALQWRTLDRRFRGLFIAHVATGQLAALPILIAGFVVLTRGAGGLYWLVPGVIFYLLDGSENAWVLLVEINR